MPLKGPNIRSLSSQVPVEIKGAIDDIRAFFESLKKQGGVASISDMQRAGLVDSVGNLISAPQATPPPILTNFAANSGFASILLTWDDPRYKYFSHVEIYRAAVDNLGLAVKIGTTTSTMYSDTPPDASIAVTYYYWGRVVGSPEIYGPYNATAGTPGSTADDPTYALQILTGQIREGQLYGDLASRIDQTDAPGSGLKAIISDLADQQLEFISRQYNEQFLGLMREKNISDATVYVDPLTGQISLLATANVTTDIEARISDLEFNMDAPAGAFAILNHTAVFDRVSVTDFNAQISAINGALALKASSSYVDAAMLGISENTSPDVAGAFSGDSEFAILNLLLMGNKMNLESLAHKANIAQAQFDLKANSDAIGAEASARLLLAAAVDNNAAAILVEQTARANAISAEASARSTLATTVAGHTTSIQTQQQSINGVLGEYTVKIDANGVTAGVGLINGPLGSEFGVRAGKFFVVDPLEPTTQLLPFIVSGGKTIINTLLVGDATIKSAMIETVKADKLFVSSGTIADAIIGTGHLTNAMIGNLIQSNSYAPGFDGWSINKNGAVEFNSGTFRGTVVFRSGSSGYTNITDRPTSLTDINSTEASSLSTVSGWKKPGETLIDGNKIFTGDAYVDTLQIKGQAVTFAQSKEALPNWYACPIVNAQYYCSVDTLTLPFTSTGGTVYISYAFEASILGAGVAASFLVTIMRNDTVVYTIMNRGASTSGVATTGFFLDTPIAGTVTYSIHMESYGARDGVNTGKVAMFMLETKR